MEADDRLLSDVACPRELEAYLSAEVGGPQILVNLLTTEVSASRLLQRLMFDTRRRNRPHFKLFHRPILADGPFQGGGF